VFTFVFSHVNYGLINTVFLRRGRRDRIIRNISTFSKFSDNFLEHCAKRFQNETVTDTKQSTYLLQTPNGPHWAFALNCRNFSERLLVNIFSYILLYNNYFHNYYSSHVFEKDKQFLFLIRYSRVTLIVVTTLWNYLKCSCFIAHWDVIEYNMTWFKERMCNKWT